MRSLAILSTLVLLLSGCASEAPADTADPMADSDGDGYPDMLELRLGSDPANATSVPDVRVDTALAFAETASVTIGTDGLSVLGGCGLQGQLDIDRLGWTIEAPANTTDAFVTGLRFTLRLTSPTLLDADIFVFDPDGRLLGESTAFNPLDGATETVQIDGTHPTGDYVIEVRGCSGSGSAAVEGQATLSYIPSIEELLHMEGVEHKH